MLLCLHFLGYFRKKDRGVEDTEFLFSASTLSFSAYLDIIMCAWFHTQKVFYNIAGHNQVIEVFALVYGIFSSVCFWLLIFMFLTSLLGVNSHLQNACLHISIFLWCLHFVRWTWKMFNYNSVCTYQCSPLTFLMMDWKGD